MVDNDKIYLINFLLERLNDDYKSELARKDILESKALGYFTILGIILANIIAIQIAFFSYKSMNSGIKAINFIILIACSIFLLFFIINGFLCYRISNRKVFSVVGKNWNEIIDTSKESIEMSNNKDDNLDLFIKTYRSEIKNIIENNKKINDNLVRYVSNLYKLTFASSILLFFEITLFIIQFII